MGYRVGIRRVARVSELVHKPGRQATRSVAIARSLLMAVDEVAGTARRSDLVEHAVRRYLRTLVRRARRERELALLDRHAARLNAAAAAAAADQEETDAA
jgi:metal-responsive CopG/Arc/MetJ family transcriptional regulator